MDFQCGCPVQGHLAACLPATWYTVGSWESLHTRAHMWSHICTDTGGDRGQGRTACDSYARLSAHSSPTLPDRRKNQTLRTPGSYTGLSPRPPPCCLSPRGASQSVSPCPAPSTAAVIPTPDTAPSYLLMQPMLQAPHSGWEGWIERFLSSREERVFQGGQAAPWGVRRLVGWANKRD